jgi:ATP-dependent RNA helicase DDX20
VQPIREEDANVVFRDLLLSEPVQRGLADCGFVRPSPIQLAAIPVGRFGTDIIAQAKAGTGKTCVFAVIALELVQPQRAATQAVVVVPTREIATQVCSVVRAIGAYCEGPVHTEVFIGGMAVARDRDRCARCHIAVGTPGRCVSSLLPPPPGCRYT